MRAPLRYCPARASSTKSSKARAGSPDLDGRPVDEGTPLTFIASSPLIGAMRRVGLPMTKAGALRAMFEPGDPTFPLDVEVIGRIPEGLPDPLPTSIETLFDLRKKRKKK